MSELPVAKPEDGSWVQWEERALFYLKGPDATRYLNGQVSNNVSRDLSKRTIAACLCSLKGRVESLVWITKWNDGFLIDGEIGERESIGGRLDRYLIADDCELVDRTGELQLFHRFGEQQEGKASFRLGVPAIDCWVESGFHPPFDEERRIGGETLEHLRLFSLLPEAGKEISGDEFPSELGLDKWAVDFHKGCYLGQEVISRIESVGKTKRKLILFQTDEVPNTGKSVELDDGRSGLVKRHFPKKFKEKYWGAALVSERNRNALELENKPLRASLVEQMNQFERPI